MSENGGGLGRAFGPGTRLGRQLGENSELWLNVKFAIVAAVAADVFLLVLILNVLWIGWWTVPVLACVFGALIGLSGLVFAYWFRFILPEWLEFLLGSLWAIMAILGIGAGAFGRSRIDPALKELGQQIWSVFDLPWWVAAIGGVLLVAFAAVARKWKPVLVFAIVEAIAGLILSVDLDAVAQIWHVLKWLMIPFSWPFGGMALVLVPVMFREMFWPNAEFTLQPVDVKELGPGGLWSFYFPRLLKEQPSIPAQTYAVEGELQLPNGDIRYLKFGLDDYDQALRWHRFCKAVYYDKKNFSYNEAVKRHHLSDDSWDNIYAAFTSQHWVIPNGQRGTPELRGAGKGHVRMFAENPPTPPQR